MVRGRLAPSPTGLLHLGNAWSFLLAWLGVRLHNGALALRIEDIDPARSKPEFTAAILQDLKWLGLDWDEGPDVGGPHAPYTQSARLLHYEVAVQELLAQGLAYPCYCTRQELRSIAGAPQSGDAQDGVYSGLCKGLSVTERATKEKHGRKASIRLSFPPSAYATVLSFKDMVLGQQHLSPQACAGDFVIRRSDKVFAYQLAVSLDDMAMGITQVVRGADILCSTPRQLLLFDIFKASPPLYAHVPLLLDHEKERLAKRHASLTLHSLRTHGVTPQQVVGYLAHLGGLTDAPEAISCHDILHAYAGYADKNHLFSLLPRELPLLPENAPQEFAAL